MGTSYCVYISLCSPRDHPHAYGDKRVASTMSRQHTGSSPRVWGQDLLALAYVDVVGIIPTRMGTSTMIYNNSLGAEDHPHAYGDKTLCRVCVWDAEGSSPRVWGQARTTAPYLTPDRIIPTRMGTSRACDDLRHPYQDHPHAYGDKSARQQPPIVVLGSSPRVWGQEASW